jgi:hypothetical protein
VLEGHGRFQAGQRCSETEMWAEPEAMMSLLFTADIESLRVRPAGRVPVGRPMQYIEHVAGVQISVGQRRLRHHAAGSHLTHAGPAENLLQGGRHQGGVLGRHETLVRMFLEHDQTVAISLAVVS